MPIAPMVPPELMRIWEESLADEISRYAYGPSCADSPLGLLLTEQFRKDVALVESAAERAACDVFVMALGEAPERHVTKFGGLPYRPAGLAWPTSAEGRPLTFAGQFCFADSRDLFPELPGDVLLVFVDGDYFVSNEGYFQFEWQPLGLGELVTDAEREGDPWPHYRGYGLRHRTWDFLDIQTIGEIAVRKCRLMTPDQSVEAYWDHLRRCAARLPTIKIGGLLCWPSVDEYEIPKSQRFLCSIGEIARGKDERWPAANREQPMTFEETRAGEARLFFYDGFIVNIFLDDDETVVPYLDLG